MSPQLQRLARKCSNVKYGTFQKANNKGADQTARMGRLVCACVVRKSPKSRFSRVEAQITLMFEHKRQY